MSASADDRRCTVCGKADPDILRGYHVTELCVCGLGKVGKKWVWIRAITAEPKPPPLPRHQLDLF